MDLEIFINKIAKINKTNKMIFFLNFKASARINKINKTNIYFTYFVLNGSARIYIFFFSLLIFFMLFIEFQSLFGKGIQVRINILFFHFFYSDGNFENKINRINIYFLYFIYSGGNLENKTNKIKIYSDLSSFPKKTWKCNK